MGTLQYFVGGDFGQLHDYSAQVTLQGQRGADGKPVFGVVDIHRWPLGTPYPTIVGDMRDVFLRPPLPGATLALDRTGVGVAVTDYVVSSLRTAKVRCRLLPITITGGSKAAPDDNGFGWSVPKIDLVGVIQNALGTGRLKIAASLPLAKTLIAELKNFKAKTSVSGHESFEAWRSRDHDDIVLALALALWCGERSLRRADWGERPKARDPIYDPVDTDPVPGRCAAAQAPPGVFND